MDKLLEVREFDTITGNADFKSDEKYKYLDTAAFHDLVEFIHEFLGDEENADALDFMRISYKRNVGDVVTIKNYVGLIQMRNVLDRLPGVFTEIFCWKIGTVWCEIML